MKKEFHEVNNPEVRSIIKIKGKNRQKWFGLIREATLQVNKYGVRFIGLSVQ